MIQRSEDDSRRHHCPAFKPDVPAKAAIADDGEFGVQQVADRILNVAKGIIKNDPARLDAVRAAIQEGFDEAANIMKGTPAPPFCTGHYQRIVKKLIEKHCFCCRPAILTPQL